VLCRELLLAWSLLASAALIRQACDTEYDRFLIERPLIDMVSRLVTSFQTQDVSFLPVLRPPEAIKLIFR
jgi:hypothetical protein